MLLLSFTMFILGVASFLDTVFSYGSTFRTGFSAMLILLAIWTFIRARAVGDLWKIEIKPNIDATQEMQKPQDSQPVTQNKKKPEPVG